MTVNIISTKEYYKMLSMDSLCDCDYCELYYEKAKRTFPELAGWLDIHGIDIGKPFEVISIGPDENGVLNYIGVQYIVFGSCPDDYSCSVGDISIRNTDFHPRTEIKEDHFVLEIYPMSLTLGG